jgi:thiol-disulfide isomerase/thioredoxin
MSLANFHSITGAIPVAPLKRVSLINFWESWAEPCKQTNEVVLELPKKYPEVLVLQASSFRWLGDITTCVDCAVMPGRYL